MPHTFTKGKTRIYPWEKWANGKQHTLRRGKQFNCAPVSIQAQAHFYARQNGLTVQTNRLGDTVVIQFTPQENSESTTLPV